MYYICLLKDCLNIHSYQFLKDMETEYTTVSKAEKHDKPEKPTATIQCHLTIGTQY